MEKTGKVFSAFHGLNNKGGPWPPLLFSRPNKTSTTNVARAAEHTDTMKELHDLEILLRSHTPLLLIESLEEPRIVQLFTRLALRMGEPAWQWTVTEGLRRLETGLAAVPESQEPPAVLRHIKAVARGGVFLLLDFHPYLDDALNVRLLKEIAQGYEAVPRTLVLVSHALNTPPELRHLTAHFELQLPDRAALLAMINEEAKLWEERHGRRVRANREAVTRLADDLLGVTTSDARGIIRDAIQRDGAITQNDLPQVMQAKFELLGQGGAINFEHDTARFADVAGLRRLKRWLEQRKPAFAGNARLDDRPKGVLLLGVQGGGKSLAAKAVAGLFEVPLLHLDFSALYNKYIGETEKNLRQALKTAETMAPCVLWLDEIDKGLSPGDSDDGVSRRLLGSLLTWMAEQKQGVFIVATANDIQRLPPELLRKGRLDEIFFVDLPDDAARRSIFSIHLRKRNLAPSGFDLDTLAQNSEGFTGAEIEQAVVSALYAARARDQTPDDRHLLEELERTQPLSVVMAEQVASLRHWARERTVLAD
jgi:hypothetical protein